jgi:hypothetical protein
MKSNLENQFTAHGDEVVCILPNLQVADKSLAVEFKNPWKYVAEFNSDPITILARQRGNLKKVNWRRERDSNPRYGLTRKSV